MNDKHLKWFGRAALAIGIAMPVLLGRINGCDVGLLGIIRGHNAYIIPHPGGSWDYNGQFKTDEIIVFGISTILVAIFFATRKYENRKKIIIAILQIIGIEVGLIILTFAVNFDKCFTF